MKDIDVYYKQPRTKLNAANEVVPLPDGSYDVITTSMVEIDAHAAVQKFPEQHSFERWPDWADPKAKKDGSNP